VKLTPVVVVKLVEKLPNSARLTAAIAAIDSTPAPSGRPAS
jgi:hypothetical protein